MVLAECGGYLDRQQVAVVSVGLIEHRFEIGALGAARCSGDGPRWQRVVLIGSRICADAQCD